MFSFPGPSSCSSRVEAERSKLRKIHPAPNLRENGLAATNAAKVRGAVTLALLASAIVPDDGGAGVRLPEGAEKLRAASQTHTRAGAALAWCQSQITPERGSPTAQQR